VHDRSGPARLLDVVAGRSATALASWLSAQTADFAQTVQVIAMDGFAGSKTAAAQVVIDPNSTVLNRSGGLDSEVRSCPSSR
jgi:transposase